MDSPEIHKEVEKVLSRVKNIFNVNDVTVQVEENPDKVIPETGVGGFTPDSHTIYLYFDSNNPMFKAHSSQNIKSTITHEFHHAIRNRTIDWKTDTLLGAMVTEGLADYFDQEINGGKPKPWSIALDDVELRTIRTRAELEFNDKKYNHEEWFFGSPEKNIPKWAGYSLGYKIVGDYIDKSGKKASELTSTSPEIFI